MQQQQLTASMIPADSTDAMIYDTSRTILSWIDHLLHLNSALHSFAWIDLGHCSNVMTLSFSSVMEYKQTLTRAEAIGYRGLSGYD